jgi:hypothetical protein
VGQKKILATLGGTIISRTNKNFNCNSNFISHLEELSKAGLKLSNDARVMNTITGNTKRKVKT